MCGLTSQLSKWRRNGFRAGVWFSCTVTDGLETGVCGGPRRAKAAALHTESPLGTTDGRATETQRQTTRAVLFNLAGADVVLIVAKGLPLRQVVFKQLFADLERVARRFGTSPSRRTGTPFPGESVPSYAANPNRARYYVALTLRFFKVAQISGENWQRE
jgi:hypothetical protein